MPGQNPPPTHTTSDDDEIQILDEVLPKSRISATNARPRSGIVLSNKSANDRLAQPQVPAITSHPYSRVHYNIARTSVAHGDVIDPLDFPDSPSQNSSEEEISPLNPFSAARISTVKHLKYNHDHSNLPYLPLSFEETRKVKLSQLSSSDSVQVEKKEKELQKAFEDDCATHGYFAQCYINKNKSLEESIRSALNETLKDLETKYMKELDIYTDLFIPKSND